MTPSERAEILETLEEIYGMTSPVIGEEVSTSTMRTKEQFRLDQLTLCVNRLSEIFMQILPGATPGVSIEFPELGPIDTAFQIEGRGCVVEVDRSRWVIPPEVGEIRVDDALKIRTQAGQEILVAVSGFESSVYWTRRRFVLRGVSADQLAPGDVVSWVGRLNPDER